MAVIDITIKDRIASAPAGVELVCNNPTDSIRFNFDAEWSGIAAKTARFSWEGKKIDVPFSGNVVKVPEIFQTNYVYVGVFTDKLTTTPAKVNCKYSIKCLGGKVPAPSEDVYGEIIALVNESLAEVEGVKTDISDIQNYTPRPFEVSGNPVQLENFEGMPMNVVCRFDPIQKGSGDPSPSNIRPITGRTGAELVRCGRNLLNLSVDETDSFSFYASNGTDGSIVIKNTHTDTVYPKTVWTKIPAGIYSLTGKQTNPSVQCYLQRTAQDYTTDISKGVSTITFTEDTQVRLLFAVNASHEVTATYQLELGPAPTAFESYQGDTYAINFGQTVYGGTLDWNKGEMMVDCGLFTLDGTELWSYSSVGFMYTTMSAPPMGAPQVPQIGVLSSHYRTDNVAITEYPHLRIYDTGYDSVDKWRAFLAAQYAAGTPVQIAYKLANPITISLTPQQITALVGVNTVYGDADEITVSGRKDILWLTDYLLKRVNELESAVISMGGNV